MLAEKPKIIILSALILAFLAYTFLLYFSLPQSAPADLQADRGKMLWQQHNCTACHQVYGLGGYLGPDLTNSFSKKGPDYIKAFLRNGTNIMPDFNLDEADINALVAYLQNIDASGNASPVSFTIKSNGTIHQ